MTETAHTPLPWTFEAGVEDNEGEFYVCHAGTVCTETTVCNPHSEADARFIVQAVNSHHRLVEALGRMIEIAHAYGEYISQVPSAELERHPYLPGLEHEIDDARAALKEAGRG